MVMVSLHKNGEGGTASSAPLAISSASTVKHGAARQAMEKSHIGFALKERNSGGSASNSVLPSDYSLNNS